jgi:hypothetical protein
MCLLALLTNLVTTFFCGTAQLESRRSECLVMDPKSDPAGLRTTSQLPITNQRALLFGRQRSIYQKTVVVIA